MNLRLGLDFYRATRVAIGQIFKSIGKVYMYKIGKSNGNGDFLITYVSSTSLSVGNISVNDIESIRVTKATGATILKDVIKLSMTKSGDTLSILSGLTLESTDEITIYTNVPANKAYDNSLDINKSMIQANIPRFETDPSLIVSAQDLTASEVDFGGSINCTDTSKIGIYIITDVNDSLNVTLSAYAKTAGDATELYLVDGLSQKTLWTTEATDGFLYYEYNVGAINFLQFRAKAGTVGTTAGDLTIMVRKVA